MGSVKYGEDFVNNLMEEEGFNTTNVFQAKITQLSYGDK